MTTFLYIISEGDAGPIKVGVSNSHESRLCSLQSGNSKPLRLDFTLPFASRDEAFRAEGIVHKFLSETSMVGEWFDFEPRMAVAATIGCLHP